MTLLKGKSQIRRNGPLHEEVDLLLEDGPLRVEDHVVV